MAAVHEKRTFYIDMSLNLLSPFSECCMLTPASNCTIMKTVLEV
jgi:hypothetical protein